MSLEFDDREVRKALRDLERTGISKVAAGALNRVAFEMRDAEAKHARDVFDFAGAGTRTFLADRGFLFDRATPNRLEVRLFARPRAASIFLDHVEGEEISARDRDHLVFDEKLAVPIGVKRGKSGRVPKRLHPAEVTQPGRRGFVNRRRTAILQRESKRSRTVRLLYALVDRAKLRPVFRFHETAFRTARRVLPSKVARELEKLRLGR